MIRLVATAAIALALAGCSPAAELLVFTAKRCPACDQFKRDYKADPSITEPFAVRILDATGPEGRAHGVRSVPTFVIVDGETTVAERVGYRGTRHLRAWLESVGR